MLIEDVEKTTAPGVQEIAATIKWEDSDRPTLRMHFRVAAEATEGGHVFPDEPYGTFLLASLAPAIRHHEKRIRVAGPVCPWLVDNLQTLTACLRHWFWYDYGPEQTTGPTIEGPALIQNPIASRRVGSFFSGGVDSLYTRIPGCRTSWAWQWGLLPTRWAGV